MASGRGEGEMSLSSWRKPDLGADGKIKSADADMVRS